MLMLNESLCGDTELRFITKVSQFAEVHQAPISFYSPLFDNIKLLFSQAYRWQE